MDGTMRERASLRSSNRRILASRMHWPDGVVTELEAFDALHGLWESWWRAEVTAPGFEHPAGFVACHVKDGQTVCAPTLEILGSRLSIARLDRHWSWHPVCCAQAEANIRGRGGYLLDDYPTRARS